MKELGSFQESVLNLYAAWCGKQSATQEDSKKATERLAVVFDSYTKRTSDLWRTKMVSELLLDEKVLLQVHNLEQSSRNVIALAHSRSSTPQDFQKLIASLAEECKKVVVMVREDLLRS